MVTIPDWIKQSKQLTEAVIKDAWLELAIEANKSRFKGGRMPIDTGFLTNSTKASIGSLPSGTSVAPDNYSQLEWDSGNVALTINGMEIGDKLYIGWTASYAQYMENRYMFARSATQKWPEIVNDSVSKMRQRFK